MQAVILAAGRGTRMGPLTETRPKPMLPVADRPLVAHVADAAAEAGADELVFIVGPEGEEGNRFRDLITDLDLDCFVLNTGYLGDRSKDLGVEESVALLREIARGTVEWTDSEDVGLTIPRSVPGMDIDEFAVPDHVEDYEAKLRELRTDRREYLSEFEELDGAIEDAVY